MPAKTIKFSSAAVQFHFDTAFTQLKELVDSNNAVIITDENIFEAHKRKFKGWNCIVLKPGEEFKIQPTVDSIIEQLVTFGADRKTILIGVGGGVITDITGYVAAIYMRGVQCAFVPTSILAMVDASIGGKNGIDVGVYKNMVGTIRQPSFLLYDLSFLKTLPHAEWVNGFAEIIKHAAILDKQMFSLLQLRTVQYFQKNKTALAALIQEMHC
jgi:3-dehydroquinate synthetase